MATPAYPIGVRGPMLPPPTRESKRISARPMRWRSSAPTLQAIRRDFERAGRIAVTITEPSPGEVAS